MDSTSEKISLDILSNMQFIHEPTFCKYISGNQELVVSVGIKGVIYKVTILAIIDLVVRYD